MPPRPLEYPRVLFDETQRPRQWWLWALLIALSIVPATVLLYAASRHPQMWRYVPLMLLPCALPELLLVVVRLRVTVTSSDLIIRFFPLRRRIAIGEIVTWEPTEYRPIREFGGWGIKWSVRDSTTAYTMQRSARGPHHDQSREEAPDRHAAPSRARGRDCVGEGCFARGGARPMNKSGGPRAAALKVLRLVLAHLRHFTRRTARRRVGQLARRAVHVSVTPRATPARTGPCATC